MLRKISISVQRVDFLSEKGFKEEREDGEKDEGGTIIAVAVRANAYLVLLCANPWHNQNYHPYYIPLHQKSHLCRKILPLGKFKSPHFVFPLFLISGNSLYSIIDCKFAAQICNL